MRYSMKTMSTMVRIPSNIATISLKDCQKVVSYQSTSERMCVAEREEGEGWGEGRVN